MLSQTAEGRGAKERSRNEMKRSFCNLTSDNLTNEEKRNTKMHALLTGLIYIKRRKMSTVFRKKMHKTGTNQGEKQNISK